MQRQDHDGAWMSAPLRLGLLLASLIVLACGGGNPSGPGPGGGGSVSIAPEGLTLPVGGLGGLTADARDSRGTPLPGSAVTWSSLNSHIASVDTTGMVTGESVGTTQVLASTGTEADTVPVSVVDSTCDGIAAVREWRVKLKFVYTDYSDIAAVAPSATVTVLHVARVASTLTPVGPGFGGMLEWSGSFVAGPDQDDVIRPPAVEIDETSSDSISDPTEVATLKGKGDPVPTAGVDGFTLRVDPSSCTYQYFAAPSVHATITVTEHAVNTLPGPDEGTRSFEQDFPLGLIQERVTPLGSWRTAGLGRWPDYGSYDSYSVAYVPAGQRAYIPYGEFAQSIFGFPPSPAPRGETELRGRADVFYKIDPTLP